MGDSMYTELELAPLEYINYEHIGAIDATSDRKRRNQRRLLFKSIKEEADTVTNDAQDSSEFGFPLENTEEIFEPKKLFMKSRQFIHLGGSPDMFMCIDRMLRE